MRASTEKKFLLDLKAGWMAGWTHFSLCHRNIMARLVVDKSTSRLTSNYIKVSFYVETEERDQHSYSNIELK
jgi:hypothetical protein